MYTAAVNGAVQDDAYGYGTFWPAMHPQLPDISATPNLGQVREILSDMNAQVAYAAGINMDTGEGSCQVKQVDGAGWKVVHMSITDSPAHTRLHLPITPRRHA